MITQSSSKQHKLDEVAREIEKCRMCKRDSSGRAVPGEGNPDADIVFLGEAPGKTEAATGRPFVGRSGQLLRKLIRSAGFKEEDVYITSPVKYLPDRGTPNAGQIAHGRKHLVSQLDVINPRYIVLLGSTAVQAMIGVKLPILSAHGRIIEENGRKYFVTLHPAAVLRFPKYTPLIKKDFEKIAHMVQ